MYASAPDDPFYSPLQFRPTKKDEGREGGKGGGEDTSRDVSSPPDEVVTGGGPSRGVTAGPLPTTLAWRPTLTRSRDDSMGLSHCVAKGRTPSDNTKRSETLAVDDVYAGLFRSTDNLIYRYLTLRKEDTTR